MQISTTFFRPRNLLINLILVSSALSAWEEDHFLTSPDAVWSDCQMDPCGQNRFFVIADYLYWQPNISGLELSFGKSSITQGISNGVTFTDTVEFDIDPHFDWNSGYRVGGGMQLQNTNVSFGAVWTQYYGRGERKVRKNHGHCKVSLEQIDAFVAYKCAWSDIAVEPFLGLRATKINHSIRSSVITPITILPATSATASIEFDDSQHFKGIGPALGVYGDWTIGCGFGLYGEAAFSIQYGDYIGKFYDSDAYSAPLLTASTAKTQKHFHRFNKTVDLGLGVFWNTSFCNGMDLEISLGYELHQYYIISFLGADPGDITFHGGVLSFGIEF